MARDVSKIRLEMLPRTSWHEEELLGCWSKDLKTGRFRLTMKLKKDLGFLFNSFFDERFSSDVMEVALYHSGIDDGKTRLGRDISFGELLNSQPEGDRDCIHIEYAVEPLKADPPFGLVDRSGRPVASAGRVLAKSKPPPQSASKSVQKVPDASQSTTEPQIPEPEQIPNSTRKPRSRKRRAASTPTEQAAASGELSTSQEDLLLLPG